MLSFVFVGYFADFCTPPPLSNQKKKNHPQYVVGDAM